MVADRAVRDADAPADPPEPDTQRHTVLATIGRLLVEAWRGCLAEQTKRKGTGNDDSG